MSNYEICYLTAEGHMSLAYIDNFTSDDDARGRATRYLRPRVTRAEIWLGGALIGVLAADMPHREGAPEN